MARAKAKTRETPAPQLSDEARDVHEALASRDRTSIKEFVESFPVLQKRVDKKTGSAMVSFTERDAQETIRAAIEQCWEEGFGAKIVCLKDRQQGISEIICRIFLERLLRGGGGFARVIAQKDQATEGLLERMLFIQEKVPDATMTALGATLDWKRKDEGFGFTFADGNRSAIKIQTARDDAFGRSAAVRWLWFSEYPWWKTGHDKLDGLTEAWEDAPGNICIFEFTGKTFDHGYDVVVRAKEGRSGFLFIFFSWLTHPDKRRRFRSEKQRAEFEESVGKIETYGIAEEVILQEEHSATLEQLHWRRVTIDGPGFNGDIEKFKREHPTVWSDAFLAEDTQLYKVELLKRWLPLGEKLQRTSPRGDFDMRDDLVEFHKDRRGRWLILEEPTEGIVYAFGADPAAGKRVQADGRPKGDLSVIQIREVLTRKVVAMCSGYIEPDEFGREVVRGSAYYGEARGYVEANNHGISVIDEIERLERSHILLARRRPEVTDAGKRWHRAPGFLSTKNSKVYAVDLSRRWVRNLQPPREGERGVLPASTIMQMMRYSRLGSRGQSMGATVGHDDEVSADYLCHAAIEMILPMVDTMSTVPTRLTVEERYILQGDIEELAKGGGFPDRDLGAGY